MILIGYYGIGKSELAKQNIQYIDLSSSLFNKPLSENKIDKWYIIYTRVAKELSFQGYNVFIEYDKRITDLLASVYYNDVYIIYPDITLETAWILKLKERYDITRTDLDKKAWKHTAVCFKEDITNMMQLPFKPIIIKDMSYKLLEIINQEV